MKYVFNVAIVQKFPLDKVVWGKDLYANNRNSFTCKPCRASLNVRLSYAGQTFCYFQNGVALISFKIWVSLSIYGFN